MNESKSIITPLIKLNLIDHTYYQKLAEKQKLEAALQAQSEVVAVIADQLGSLQSSLKSKQLTFTRQEQFLKAEQAKLVDRRKALSTLSDYKLQEKAHKEVDQAVRLLAVQEEQLIISLESLEKIRAAIANKEEALATEQAKLDEVTKEATETATAVDAKISELETERQALMVDFHPKDLNIYKRISGKYPGKAVVAVDENFCSGCYFNLGPQQMVQLSRREQIVTCPNCGRLLYMDVEKTEEDSEKTADSSAQEVSE